MDENNAREVCMKKAPLSLLLSFLPLPTAALHDYCETGTLVVKLGVLIDHYRKQRGFSLSRKRGLIHLLSGKFKNTISPILDD